MFLSFMEGTTFFATGATVGLCQHEKGSFSRQTEKRSTQTEPLCTHDIVGFFVGFFVGL
jgi:hypothetical protein